MTCGTFHVQSRGILWVLSTVYLVRAVLPLFGSSKLFTHAAFNLIIQRPRIAGGTLTIPIDSTVRLVKCSRREAAHNTIRLRYGNARKCLVMRASDSLEREKWLVGIIAAIGATTTHEPISSTARTLSENSSDSNTSSTSDDSHHQIMNLNEPQTPSSAVESEFPATPEAIRVCANDSREAVPDHRDTVFLPLPASVDEYDIPAIDMRTPPSPRTLNELYNSPREQLPEHNKRSLWRRTRQQISIATHVLAAFGQGIVPN